MASPIEILSDLGKRLGRLLGLSAPADAGEARNAFANVAWAFVKNAYAQTSERREHIQKLRDFYTGDQIIGTGLNEGDVYVPAWPDESDDDLDARAERMQAIAWNRIRDGIHTHADALYAWGRERAVSRDIRWPEGATVSAEDQKWLDTYFRDRFQQRNGFTQFMWELWAKVGAEQSAVVLGMWMDGKARRLKRFAAGVSVQDMKDRGLVWLETLDSLQVIALPHPDTPRELGAIIRWYSDPTEQSAIASTPMPGDKDTITELITDTFWLRWKGTEMVPHAWGMENRYGDVRTLFSWIRNPADIADSEDALSAQVLLLEHLYSGWEIKRNHAFPETLYAGYEPPTREVNGRKVLLRGPNIAHSTTEKDAKILKVAPPAGIEDIGIGDAQMHSMIDEAMGLSAIERGENMGQLRSAPGIGRMQSKSERRRRRKILAAEKGEHDLFEMVRDQTVFHAISVDVNVREAFLDAQIIVTYPEDAFTLDPFTMAQKDQVEVTAGLTELRDQVKKRNPGLSDAEIEEKLKRIQKEQKTAAELAHPVQNPTSKSNSQN